MTIDLLPCPFCGGPERGINRVTGDWFASCSCGAIGPCENTEAEAIATWNRRSPAPAMIATIQAQAERVRVLEDALRQVIAWDLPRVPDLHRPGSNVSYGFVYGSNGERDYFRAIARAALGDKS